MDQSGIPRVDVKLPGIGLQGLMFNSMTRKRVHAEIRDRSLS